MNTYQVIALLITLTATFAYLNHRFLKLAPTIGIMVLSLVHAIALLLLGVVGVDIHQQASELLARINFADVLMNGMLGFLLFAGALHVNLEDLYRQKWPVSILATLGVVASTFLVGGCVYLLSQAIQLNLTMPQCLVFGALISPTDPIAVIGALKSAKTPKSLETKIIGESLFNDGIGVVVFVVILTAATSSEPLSTSGIATLLFKEAIGGIILGLAVGGAGFYLLKVTDDYQVEILVTLAMVAGGYALAQSLHTSGPLAVVVAGLLVGNHGRRLAMSDKTREHLDTFWLLIDEILNAVLFVLIGLEVLILTFSSKLIVAGFAAVFIALLARFLTISSATAILRRFHNFSPHAAKIMTWSGLRGGISVALALSIPEHAGRHTILGLTYVVVVFSIVVQGLTLAPMVKKLLSTKT
ncbi:MAG: sodium:proton antiporter [Acidobacteria bacterium]|nr:sodium:proton antiporter [Acidobacteriota bacterium]